MIIFRKILIIFVAFLGIFALLIGILHLRTPHTVVISQKPLDIRPHAAVSGNISIDYTSPIRKIDPIAIGMDVSGYGYPNVFANDQVEQQKLKTLIKIPIIIFITGLWEMNRTKQEYLLTRIVRILIRIMMR